MAFIHFWDFLNLGTLVKASTVYKLQISFIFSKLEIQFDLSVSLSVLELAFVGSTIAPSQVPLPGEFSLHKVSSVKRKVFSISRFRSFVQIMWNEDFVADNCIVWLFNWQLKGKKHGANIKAVLYNYKTTKELYNVLLSPHLVVSLEATLSPSNRSFLR